MTENHEIPTGIQADDLDNILEPGRETNFDINALNDDNNPEIFEEPPKIENDKFINAIKVGISQQTKIIDQEKNNKEVKISKPSEETNNTEDKINTQNKINEQDEKGEEEEKKNKNSKTKSDEDKLDKIRSFFKKIKITKKEINQEHFNSYYGLFFCDKKNETTGIECKPGNEICPDCMKKNQKLYGLKPHYLINSMGRVCTFKKSKIYCLGKISKIETLGELKSGKTENINYSIMYVCRHSNQCESCRNLTKIMDNYFDARLLEDLKKRDIKYGN